MPAVLGSACISKLKRHKIPIFYAPETFKLKMNQNSLTYMGQHTPLSREASPGLTVGLPTFLV